MKSILSQEKSIFSVSIFLACFAFFTPISTTCKSIFLALSLLAVLVMPYYRPFLSYSFNTVWARAGMVCFIYVILACLWSEAPLSVRLGVADKYSKLMFLPILAAGFVNARARIWVINAYLAVILITCILSFLKAHDLLVLNRYDSGEVFYNHIATGYMIVTGLYLASLQLFKKELNRWHQGFYCAVLLLGNYQIIFINTGKTAYLVYGLLMTLLLLQKMSLRKALSGLVLFGCLVLVAYKISPSIERNTQALLHEIHLLRHNDVTSSLGFRVQFHQYAQSLFATHPFTGLGTGSFQYRFSQDRPVAYWGEKLNEPHSQYWFILVEQGLVGLVLWLIFLVSLFLDGRKLKETKAILVGVWVPLAVLSFTDTIFSYSPMGSLAILFSALCFGELIENSMEYKKIRHQVTSRVRFPFGFSQ